MQRNYNRYMMTEDMIAQLGEYGALGLFVIYLAYLNHSQTKRTDTMRESYENTGKGFCEELSSLGDKIDESTRLLKETQRQQQMMLAMKAARAKTSHALPVITPPEE